MKKPSRNLKLVLAILVTALWLAARLLLRPSPDPIHRYLIWLLAGSLVLCSLIFTIESIIRRQRGLAYRLRAHGSALSGLVMVLTLLLCMADIASGSLPFLFLPGLVVYGTLRWHRPWTILLWTSLGALSLAGFSLLYRGQLPGDSLSIMGIAIAMSFFSADSVKRNLAPTEERLKSLEAENQELWTLSYHDPLTGLYNRRYVNQAATHLVSRATRYKETLHVLMLDIDHFKRVNDTLGHAVGDKVLQAVASLIQGFIRSSDIAARYGGEEFIVYLVKANPETAQYVANRIRDGVAAMSLPEIPWTVTISIGVAHLLAEDSMESLIERADKYLYASKQQGRNRVSGF